MVSFYGNDFKMSWTKRERPKVLIYLAIAVFGKDDVNNELNSKSQTVRHQNFSMWKLTSDTR